MGTPEISAYVFNKMIEDGYHFVGLVAQPDHPVGRKGLIEKVPTKVVAEKYNIPVFQPVKIRHVSDQNIARCNKNIEPIIKENKKVFQKIFQRPDESRPDIYF